MCFIHRGASIDMQHDLSLYHYVSSHDLDLRLNFDLDFLSLTCIYLDASWGEEYNGVRMISLAFLEHVICKKVKAGYIYISWTLQPNR